MILIVQICNEKLHYFEFVKPIEDVVKQANQDFTSVHYNNLSDEKLKKADKVIICGTSLKDNFFLQDIQKFNWIKDFDKPILGICGGMHILGLLFNGILKKQQEIGLTEIEFKEEFIGMKGPKQVYALHNFYVESKEFKVIAQSKLCPQAIKHKSKPFFGVLFHPEVRNRDCIEFFSSQYNLDYPSAE